MTVNGGTVTVGRNLIVTNSYNGADSTGTLDILGGTVTADKFHVKNMRQNGSAVNATLEERHAHRHQRCRVCPKRARPGHWQTATATFTIDTGGLLKTASITGVADSTYGKFVLALTGGTIEALQSNPNFMPANFTNAPVIGAGGITFNTAEF